MSCGDTPLDLQQDNNLQCYMIHLCVYNKNLLTHFPANNKQMKIQTHYSLLNLIVLLLVLRAGQVLSLNTDDDFLECLIHNSDNATSISQVIYSPNNSSYTSVLQFSINNLRFISPSTPKPRFIVTPINESQIQTWIGDQNS